MKRISVLGISPLLLALVACGGGDSASDSAPASSESSEPPAAAEPAPAATASAADWFQIDEGSMTVTINLVAGSTTDNNSWNFNGYYNGNATITVPEGYTVNVNFTSRGGQLSLTDSQAKANLLGTITQGPLELNGTPMAQQSPANIVSQGNISR